MRKRKVMKYANMWVIKLLPADIKDFELEEGDEIDIEQLPLVCSKNYKGGQ
jgi:hypothetical protein